MGRESMAEYFKTVRRLQSMGIEDPTSQIIALAEEIKRYRKKIEAMNEYIKNLKGPPPETPAREKLKVRYTYYDEDLGRYVVPLGPRLDGTEWVLNIKSGRVEYAEDYWGKSIAISKAPDLAWCEFIDKLAEYENQEEAKR